VFEIIFFFQVKCSDEIKDILGDICTYLRIEGGGHLLLLEHPQLINETIFNFLTERVFKKEGKKEEIIINSTDNLNLEKK
jgi:hypothetical protein